MPHLVLPHCRGDGARALRGRARRRRSRAARAEPPAPAARAPPRRPEDGGGLDAELEADARRGDGPDGRRVSARRRPRRRRLQGRGAHGAAQRGRPPGRGARGGQRRRRGRAGARRGGAERLLSDGGGGRRGEREQPAGLRAARGAPTVAARAAREPARGQRPGAGLRAHVGAVRDARL